MQEAIKVREIIIYRHFFTKTDCYKNRVIQQPKGIQVHSTGANNPNLSRYVGPDDGRLGENKYNNTHNRPGLSVCANAYIGKLKDGTPAIYQALPWDTRCWLSASGKNGNANKMGFVGFEICEDNCKNKEYFNQVVMGLSVNLVAYLCKEYNIPLENVLDHSELYQKGIGSNHADITKWLKVFGLTMNHYRVAVREAMDEGVQVKYIDSSDFEVKKTMYKAKVFANSGSSVNLRMNPSDKATILAKVPIGSTVDVLIESPDWYQIRYNNYTGYMMSKFLRKNETTTQQNNSVELKQIKEYLESALALVNKLLQ